MHLKFPHHQPNHDNQFLLSLSLSDKIAFYKKEIANIADTSFNKQQKQLCLDILDKATEENIDKIYQFITQRVKTGFVFDIAPEVQHDCIALIEKDKKLSFESNALGEKLTHKLIIGENYDALKNLLAVYENKIDFIYIDPPYNTESTRLQEHLQKIRRKKTLVQFRPVCYNHLIKDEQENEYVIFSG